MSHRMIAILCLMGLSWIVMTTTHELGHVIGGWLSGARLISLQIAPWALPFSLHRPDPVPLVTLWSGPIIGVAAPFLLACLTRREWSWFVSDFCLVANGIYLTMGWFSGDKYLDTTRILNEGTPVSILAIFCVTTMSVGYVRFRRRCIQTLCGVHVPSKERTNGRLS